MAALPRPKGTACFCESSLSSTVWTPGRGSDSVDVESCSRMTGDMLSVADELIVGVRSRWKMVEMTEALVSHVVADLLRPAKIIPTPTPMAAQLCVVTLGDISGNRSRWKKNSSDYFSGHHTFLLATRQGATGERRDEGGSAGRRRGANCLNGITLRWGHPGQRSLNAIFKSLGIPQISLEKGIWISQAHMIFFNVAQSPYPYIIVNSFQLLAWGDIVCIYIHVQNERWRKKKDWARLKLAYSVGFLNISISFTDRDNS